MSRKPLYFVVDHSVNALVAVCETEEDARNLVASTAARLSIYENDAESVNED